MALSVAADNIEALQRVEAGTSTMREAACLSPSALDSSRFKAGGGLAASLQVDMHERNALLGNARLQYSFHFASADSAHHNSPHKTSRQVTKREKRGLLNSSYSQYSLNFYE
ncbi:MAG TPA: hypothetical protein HPP97_14815 [Desulfuromonadales bacterium]|nr:hypothetical protein [Desulfuromonadales bacterium]